jgi:hypothetical protein
MSEPTAPCPYCGQTCHADWVSVGFTPYDVQSGPFYCEACQASQIGPYDKDRELTPEEKKFGWYKPGTPLGSSVNAIGGRPVDTQTAKWAYEMEHFHGVKLLDHKEFANFDEALDDLD